MDQVKVVLAALKKYHFWILCVVILVVYIAIWFRSTSAMTQQAATRASAITTAFNTGQKIAGISNHPNTGSAEMMKALNRAEAEQVRLAWEARFREQEDVLVWPEELLPDFIAAVEPLKPIELKVDFPTPPNQELKLEFRNRYRDYIRRELPKLADIIGAEWRVGQQAGVGAMGAMGGMGALGGMPGGMMGPMGGAGGYPGMAGGMTPYAGMGGPMGAAGMMGDENPIVVEWATSSQSAVQAASFNWTSPTTLQVLYAQEDLWVLRALMMVIKATNGDADAQYNAAIKELLSLQLGAMAGGLKDGGGAAGGMGPMGMPGMSGMMPMGGMSSPMMGSGMAAAMASAMGGSSAPAAAGGDAASSKSGVLSASPYGGAAGGGDPADNRYVDDSTEPLTGERLRSAMKSDQPADAFLAVAKRMPVRMRVRMNVLRLPLFLSEFAKSNLPVEVRQVRINPSTSGGPMGGMGPGGGIGGKFAGGAGSMGAGGPPGMASLTPQEPAGGTPMAGMMGSGAGMAGMMAGSGPPGMTGSAGMMGAMGSGSAMGGMGPMGAAGMGGDSPYDAIVEIYGLIYIYNPVNPAKLGLDTAVAQAATPDMDAANGPVASDAAAQGAPPAAADTSAVAGAQPRADTTLAAPAAGETPASDTGPNVPEVAPDAAPPATTPETGTPAPDATPAAPTAASEATTPAEGAAPAANTAADANPNPQNASAGGSE